MDRYPWLTGLLTVEQGDCSCSDNDIGTDNNIHQQWQQDNHESDSYDCDNNAIAFRLIMSYALQLYVDRNFVNPALDSLFETGWTLGCQDMVLSAEAAVRTWQQTCLMPSVLILGALVAVGRYCQLPPWASGSAMMAPVQSMQALLYWVWMLPPAHSCAQLCTWTQRLASFLWCGKVLHGWFSFDLFFRIIESPKFAWSVAWPGF